MGKRHEKKIICTNRHTHKHRTHTPKTEGMIVCMIVSLLWLKYFITKVIYRKLHKDLMYKNIYYSLIYNRKKSNQMVKQIIYFT